MRYSFIHGSFHKCGDPSIDQTGTTISQPKTLDYTLGTPLKPKQVLGVRAPSGPATQFRGLLGSLY